MHLHQQRVDVWWSDFSPTAPSALVQMYYRLDELQKDKSKGSLYVSRLISHVTACPWLPDNVVLVWDSIESPNKNKVHMVKVIELHVYLDVLSVR